MLFLLFFFNDTATTEIYTLSPTRRSSDLGQGCRRGHDGHRLNGVSIDHQLRTRQIVVGHQAGHICRPHPADKGARCRTGKRDLGELRVQLEFCRLVAGGILCLVAGDDLEAIAGVIQAQLLKAAQRRLDQDRKSTRLNSSHSQISYAVFCLKKKNIELTKYAREMSTEQHHSSLRISACSTC